MALYFRFQARAMHPNYVTSDTTLGRISQPAARSPQPAAASNVVLLISRRNSLHELCELL